MFRYKYTPLESPSRDIRLVTILPGKFKDRIRIKITHARLDPPVQDDEPKRLSLKEIRGTIPYGWRAFETFEGRVIFWNNEEEYTTWSHPDPNFPRDKYDPVDRQGEQSRVDYEALSYTWGTSESPGTAVVESSETDTGSGTNSHTQRLPINRNLEEAIRHLRYEDECRVMWIDAICINQADVEERNEQVPRIGLIYSLARRVVAWLGPSSSSSGLAFSTLDYIGRQVEFTRDMRRLPSPSCSEPRWYDRDVPLHYGADVWDAISELSLRGWFKRLWVVQEIHHGSAESILKCGNDEILWPLFRRAIRCMCAKNEGVSETTRGNTLSSYILCGYPRGKVFEEVLFNYHKRSCKDDRDKIYGLMSLASPEITAHLRVDYGQSATQVFEQTFLACVKQQKRFAQLPFSGRRYATSTTPELPTWVPDWSQPVTITVPYDCGFRASGISASRAVRMDGSRLEVKALYFTSVSCVGSQILGQDFWKIFKTYESAGFDQAPESRYPTGDTYGNAWLQTLTLGLVGDRFPLFGFPTLAKLSEAVATAQTDEAAAEGSLSAFYKVRITNWISRCYLFRAQNGYMGTIRAEPREGDEVFVILGCDIPMLLRPTPTGEYEVIGDCYVHGIMDGEAILGPIPHPWKAVTLIGSDGNFRAHYSRVDSDFGSTEDPRLEQIPIPPEWESIEWERTAADPHNCSKFRNRGTGEVINSDPRFFPEALEARGVPLRTITLV
ncbi:HET-domain-containing protein [Hypoxylon sp. FL0890]|nr:HET-domain-containing protein [Hypoxylon sp. FL0890]